MSYNPYLSSTPPRPFRIMFGFLMAATGLIMGMTGAVHEFHKASVMQGEPVEMDWETLTTQGFGDNPHIRLINVSVVDPYEELDDFFDTEGMFGDEDVEDAMEAALISQQRSLMELGPAKVIPLGRFEGDVEELVVVAQGEFYLDEAFRQIDETGSITGMVSTYGVNQMIEDFFAFCTGNEIEGPPEDGDEVVYSIIPVDGQPDLDLARHLFFIAGIALSLGLIMCGSGGPGIWCCWYAPLPSVISLIGYPMRYGRGNWTMRFVYIGIGVTLMGYGYYQLVPLGNFGAAEGNPIFHAFGFASLFIGLGAVLAVPMQITTRALDASTDVRTKKKPVRMSWQQACSMEPVTQEIEYEDATLAPAGSLPLTGEIREKADALEGNGFTKAASLQWQRASGVAAAAIQLGCQKMVVTDLEYNNDSDLAECGLISVLGTGLPIITISANSAIKQNRPSAKCLFQRSGSSDPVEMLSEHLEVVVSEAEQRDTIVVEFDESETHDVVQLARRVIAEIQGTIDGQIVNVGPKRYGRFHYPPAPVPEFVPSTV